MTYSIVALDPTTGELGVAVQSRWFSVGSSVAVGRARRRRRRHPVVHHLPGGGAVLQALGLA